jgi:hypothetical protein
MDYTIAGLRFGGFTAGGLDMDPPCAVLFTGGNARIAEYISPSTEELTYGFIVDRLLELGYPAEIRNLAYDPSFAIRGT